MTNNNQDFLPDYSYIDKNIQETIDFATLELNKPLTPLQQKIFYISVAAIKKDENPEAQALYQIDIRNLSELTETNLKSLRRNLKSAVEAIRKISTELSLRSPTIIEPDGTLKIMYGIFQGIELKKDTPNTIFVRFNYYFRQQILKMKKEYDIEYPVRSIMKMKGNYSIPLYIFLIAETAILREKRSLGEVNNSYNIVIGRDELLRKLNYTGKVAQFNIRALPIACAEVNQNTEVYIENGMPDIIRNGKSITGYIFHVRVNTSKETPIFARSLLKSNLDLVPDMEYLAYRLKSMGVADSTIKHYQAERNPDRLRIWGNMLYTWHMAGDKQPRYYKKAYSENYFSSVCGNDVEKIFRLVMLNNPKIADEYMRSIDNEYTTRGVPANQNFIKDLLLRLSNEK